MRYISINPRLTLVTNNGDPLYQFWYNELIVGSPIGTGAGNEINPTGATTEDSLQVLFTDAQIDALTGNRTPTALDRVGRGITFFEAPPITPAASTVEPDIIYIVLSGSVVYNGKTYKRGEEFTGATGINNSATTDGGTFARSFQPKWRQGLPPEQFTQENWRTKVLATGRETEYDPNVPGGFEPTDPLTIDPQYPG